MSIRSIRGWEVEVVPDRVYWRVVVPVCVESLGCATAVLDKKLFGHLFSNYG